MSPAFQSQDPQPLMEIIRKLEARVRELERILELSDGGLHLRCGSSSIKVGPKSVVISGHDIQLIGSGDIAIKASHNLVMKAAKIHEN